MNIENMNKLADHLEFLNPVNFNWESWYDELECGICACVAGWVAILGDKENHSRTHRDYNYFLNGKKWLDLTTNQARLIFSPIDPEFINISTFSPPPLCYMRYSDSIWGPPCFSSKFIEDDIKFVIRNIGLENFAFIHRNPKLVSNLIRAYMKKWQFEESKDD